MCGKFKQKEGMDYDETFSPTGRLRTMRYILNYSVQLGIRPRQADFLTAYLNSELHEEEAVYICIPDGFTAWLSDTKQETYTLENSREVIDHVEQFVINLKKSLYG